MKGSKRPVPRPAPRASLLARRPGKHLPWRTWEQQVARAQKQIAQAARLGDRRLVHALQQRLLEAEEARLLAVRRVTEENRGKDTAGVDGVKSLGPQERLAMVAAIHPANWHAQVPLPARRVWVPKPGTMERRPLAILPMLDRCKQALVKLVLEPEWEVCFEEQSYGFRPGRGAHNAIAALLAALEGVPQFVFHADIAEAFEHVNQAMLLDKLRTFPALRQMIHAWLTAGIRDGATWLSSPTGIPQGGVLSPLLLNIALHGMAAVVTQTPVRNAPLLVRYADDFVILHADLQELQQAARRVEHWLAGMGLSLHAGKTRFTHTLTSSQGRTGFDFLGFHLHHERQAQETSGQFLGGARPRRLVPARITTMVTPSQEADSRHLVALAHKLQSLRTASQARVIEELNPLIVGWAAYYSSLVPAAIMRRYDTLLEQVLLTWAGQRHPGQSRNWLLARYWQRIDAHRQVFAVPNGMRLRSYQQASAGSTPRNEKTRER